MKSKEEKELEFIRGREKLNAAPIKSPNYTSPLSQDVMPVRGGSLPIEPVTKIKNTTPHINTKQSIPLLSGDDFKNKIASRTGGGKKLGLAAILAALGVSALPDSAQASVPVQAGMRALDEGDPMSFLTPPDAGDMEDELMMNAESDAFKDYENSPAGQAARFAKSKSLIGR